MKNKVRLLPHHIGVFSSFYFKNAEKRKEIFEYFRGCGYSDSFISNMKEIFQSIIKNPDYTIEITLEKPDSICKPELNEGCKKCIDGLLLREEIAERMESDKKYGKFRRTASMLKEIEEMLYFQGLKPKKKYKSKHFMEIVENTGEKIHDLLKRVCFFPGDKLLLNNISPYSLKFKFLGNEEEIKKRFPLVPKFVDSKLDKQIMADRFAEDVIGRFISDKNLENLMENYPKLFKDSQKRVYKEAMKIIVDKKSTAIS